MMGGLIARTAWACVCVAALITFCACEDDDTSIPDVNAYQSAERGGTSSGGGQDVTFSSTTKTSTNAAVALAISPANVSLPANGDMVSLTAKGGSAPYSWQVTDVFRGSVVDAGGSSAAYQRSSAGDNTVIVTDNAGAKAYAVVDQP